MTNPPQSFNGLGIAKNLLDILTARKFLIPTPIQHQVIPAALEGKDVVGIAQTGTGKTLAFGVPMIQRIALQKGQGLVLLPTRELALQVDDVLQTIGRPLGMRTAVLIGGASMHLQLQMIRRNPHIVVATPGRLMDHLEHKNFSLARMTIIVLDEADRMFDIGFMPQIKRILSVAPRERQTMLFSATMPSEIAKLAGVHMRLPLRIEVAPAGTAAANVEQEVFII
ncbi:MAG: DEAD/DEAH box helicase, partial [Patescibacteria group bacterium]